LKNNTKQKLKEGKAVIGSIVSVNHPGALNAIGSAGFDFMLIDTQHSQLGIETIRSLIAGLQRTESDIVVRVLFNEVQLVNQALDAGADGVIVPLTNTVEDVEKAVAGAKYPPDGIRSWGPQIPPKYSGPVEYGDLANQETMVWPQIETLEAVENIDGILDVEGIDGIMIGPTDLTLSLGLPPRYPPEQPKTEETIQHVLDKCKEHNIPWGQFTSTQEVASKWLRRGGQIVTIGTDVGFVADGAAKAAAEARDLLASLEG
jgi:2-keto-3-deoxy-L-rhamnonate aldolase RhmA